MVTEYECQTCHWKGELGSFHGALVDGFEGGTLLMCSACGAQHMVKYALRPDFLEQMQRAGDRYQVTLVAAGDRHVEIMAALRRLLRCPLAEARALVDMAPVTIRDDLSRVDALELQSVLERQGASVTLTSTPPREPPHVPPQMRDELLVSVPEGHWRRLEVLGERVGPVGEFDPGAQPCGECGKVGTLISGPSGGVMQCPRCHATGVLEVGGWVT